jgi:hypothetical protein
MESIDLQGMLPLDRLLPLSEEFDRASDLAYRACIVGAMV